jgi:hypothetical protein
MTRDKNERKKLTINKLTIWNLDHQVNLLEKDQQKDVKAGENTIPTGITKLPVYCSPGTL